MDRASTVTVITGDVGSARTVWLRQDRILILSSTLTAQEASRAHDTARRRIRDEEQRVEAAG